MNTMTEDQLWEIANTIFVGQGIDGDKLVVTSEPLSNFVAKWGTPDRVTSEGVSEWVNLQTRKGNRRGDLVVFEVAGGTVSHFSGEA